MEEIGQVIVSIRDAKDDETGIVMQKKFNLLQVYKFYIVNVILKAQALRRHRQGILTKQWSILIMIFLTVRLTLNWV